MKRLKEIREWLRQYAVETHYTNAPYTMAFLTVQYEGNNYSATGFSKCKPGDEWDPIKGLLIAGGRAELQLADRILMFALSVPVDWCPPKRMHSPLTEWTAEWEKLAGKTGYPVMTSKHLEDAKAKLKAGDIA